MGSTVCLAALGSVPTKVSCCIEFLCSSQVCFVLQAQLGTRTDVKGDNFCKTLLNILVLYKQQKINGLNLHGKYEVNISCSEMLNLQCALESPFFQYQWSGHYFYLCTISNPSIPLISLLQHIEIRGCSPMFRS